LAPAAQSDAVPNLGYIPCHVQDTHCGTISDGQRVMMVMMMMVLAMVMVVILGVP
jgi:hypothetical protein